MYQFCTFISSSLNLSVAEEISAQFLKKINHPRLYWNGRSTNSAIQSW